MPSSRSIQQLFRSAVGFHQKNELQTASSLYKKILEIEPSHFDSLRLLGAIAGQLGEFENAKDLLYQALTIHQNNSEVFNNYGNVLKELGFYEKALISYEQANYLNPKNPDTFYNKGLILYKLKRYEEAIKAYENAIKFEGNHYLAMHNLGILFKDLAKYELAHHWFNNALHIQPNFPESRFAKAIIYLTLGKFEAGWPEFESRWQLSHLLQTEEGQRAFTQPLWLGIEPILGKTILIYAEQGLGDTIQFFQFVLGLHKTGIQLVIEVQAPLKNLLKNSAPFLDVYGKGEPLPHFDFRCPFMSLPLLFQNLGLPVPSLGQYLFAPQLALTPWQGLLKTTLATKVGIAWNGSKVHIQNQFRSISLEHFFPLLYKNIQFISLQKEYLPEDIEYFKNHPQLLDMSQHFNDFEDTASLISQLDLVISVDTSIAHLSGALKIPTWLLVSKIHDWRWGEETQISPYYPSMRLYRQTILDDWSQVFSKINLDLDNFS